MNRNPIIPFVLIMVMGIGLMFLLSFKGLGDSKDLAKEGEGGKTEETAEVNPEEFYQQTCAGCHGNQYEGVSGPSLKGVGSKYSQDEIKDILTNGKGNMPPGMAAGKEDQMAEWIVNELK
ncbi:cytochrome c550 [Mesobacillus thioparans]|uniref:cytochrome c550 n=1 Tax=Mesobacillus thioparans TaxID=370439 RepID=UPI0039EE5AAE